MDCAGLILTPFQSSSSLHLLTRCNSADLSWGIGPCISRGEIVREFFHFVLLANEVASVES